MVLKQYYLGCLAQASYLIGDVESGEAAVVDPRRDIEPYLEDARELGLTIKYVLLTHFHADFVAGHLELRDRIGATIHLGRRATADYAFSPVGDGDRIELGKVRLEILETPGHTPESVCFVVHDGEHEAPQAVLTGDTLFIGDVGRPDLLVSIGMTAEELAGNMYDSLHKKLLKLPDATIVYPGHGAGSMCGKNLSKETVSTIGEQKKQNYALQPMERDAFIRMLTADQPTAPDYFAFDAQLNREERPTLEKSLAESMKPLDRETVESEVRGGALLLDVRDPEDFAGGYVPGSLNIGLTGTYAVWAGTLIDHHRPVVILAEPGDEHEAVMRLGRIGFDRVLGYMKDGIAAWPAERRADRRRWDPSGLSQALAGNEPPLVLDVRNPGERIGNGIEGAAAIPLGELRGRMDELPRNRPIVVTCAGGYRSSMAASLLQANGFAGIGDLRGGMQAWEEAHAAAS